MLNRASTLLVESLEEAAASYGKTVATHPIKAALACLLITGLASVGLLRWNTENNVYRLWVPNSSNFLRDYNWLEENKPEDSRFNSVILAADQDVLTPKAFQQLAALHHKVVGIRTASNLSWSDVCFRIPAKVDIEEPECKGIPWLAPCYPTDWCPFIEKAQKPECLETSLLEIWGYNFDYSTITREQILEEVNKEKVKSKVTGIMVEPKKMLGGVTKKDGKVISAKAVHIQWIGKVNITAARHDDISDLATGQMVDKATLEWEAALRDFLLQHRNSLPFGLSSYINVARGYSDIATDTITDDAIMMPIGFIIVFVYVTFMLGRLDCLQQRSMLAGAGLTAIGMTIGFTYGICSAIGLFYGPMHNIIPFLLLGIGIDDMFVIMQCYDNLSPEEKSSPDIPSRVGLTMRRAGVAITVTSVTDFMVFAIGATTVLPALRSFCLWCGVGILAVYFYQATFFTAFLALDCRRIAARRNAFCPFFVHAEKQEKEDEEKKMGLGQRAFSHLANAILSTPGKLLVLASAAALLGGGVYGTTQLQQEFDATWFLPPTSYLRQWFTANKQFFPSTGERVKIYLTGLDLADEMDSLDHLVTSLNDATDIVDSVESWWTTLNSSLPKDRSNVTHELFNQKLTQFLHGPTGFKYRQNFEFTSELSCGVAAPPLLLSSLTFTHVNFEEKSAHYPALTKVKSIIASSNFSGNVFPLTREYSSWETDEVITRELLRNLGIALACVFITTLLLLANFLGSVIVLICVAATLVDLCGYMHFWGLTIDVISAVDIIIAIGLCVDYAVHICHAFLTVAGSKRERAQAALVDMGPAVLNGGVSTLIAFILLLSSDSYFFLTFFKIFFLTVLFGVWHGLVLLPVLLSLIGPEAYLSARSGAVTTTIVPLSWSSRDPAESLPPVLGKGGQQQPPMVGGEVEKEKSNSRFPFFALSCSCSCINHCPS